MPRKPTTRNDPFPDWIKPKLVRLASAPPAGDWRYEIKFDGYRIMTRISDRVTLFTRNGYDWTHRMPRLAAELQQLGLTTAWLDGEVVAQDDEGRPLFHGVQSAFSTGSTDDLVYFIFDLLYLHGHDLRGQPVERRRAILEELLDRVPLEHVRFSEAFDVDPRDLLTNICTLGMEGVLGKRAGSPYASDRDGAWIKLKCQNRQEFIIVGYTRAAGGVGSLLLGLHDDAGELAYAGRVQSGFSHRTLAELRVRLGALVRSESAIQPVPRLSKGLHVVWVEPRQLCEVKFAEITPAGKVRHAVFIALRDDKSATEIGLER